MKYRQNKKRIDPRYFLSETTTRDQEPVQEGVWGAVRRGLAKMTPRGRAQALAGDLLDMSYTKDTAGNVVRSARSQDRIRDMVVNKIMRTPIMQVVEQSDIDRAITAILRSDRQLDDLFTTWKNAHGQKTAWKKAHKLFKKGKHPRTKKPLRSTLEGELWSMLEAGDLKNPYRKLVSRRPGRMPTSLRRVFGEFAEEIEAFKDEMDILRTSYGVIDDAAIQRYGIEHPELLKRIDQAVRQGFRADLVDYLWITPKKLAVLLATGAAGGGGYHAWSTLKQACASGNKEYAALCALVKIEQDKVDKGEKTETEAAATVVDDAAAALGLPPDPTPVVTPGAKVDPKRFDDILKRMEAIDQRQNQLHGEDVEEDENVEKINYGDEGSWD